jgi:preprotein translocase subunit SecG
MTSTLMIVQIIFAIIITIAILLQKSASIGLGAYSGSNESLFGAKGPMGFLAKFTFIMGLLFVLNTLALGYYYNRESNRSVVDKIESKTQNTSPFVPTSIPVPTAPTQAPEAPKSGGDAKK